VVYYENSKTGASLAIRHKISTVICGGLPD